MELVQELFVTASLALLFSFAVAKLVSVAMARDSESKSSGNVVAGRTGFEERLRVEGFASERRAEFVGEEAAGSVGEFVGGCVGFGPKLGIVSCGEEVVEERCELGVVCDCGGIEMRRGSKLEEHGGVGSSEKLSEVAEVTGESNLEVIERKDTGYGVDDLVSEEKVDKIGEEVRTEILDIQRSEDVAVERCGEEGVSGGKDEGEDDWEGIERSDLEKVFAAASRFVGGEGNDDRLANVGSDTQMQLYGLHKVAMEGPCYEPQPMALKVSARAKWNAWQKLGSMSPEEAMEQYVTLLSDNVPGWMEDISMGDGSEKGIPFNLDLTSSRFPHHQLQSANERKPERKYDIEGIDLSRGSNTESEDKE